MYAQRIRRWLPAKLYIGCPTVDTSFCGRHELLSRVDLRSGVVVGSINDAKFVCRSHWVYAASSQLINWKRWQETDDPCASQQYKTSKHDESTRWRHYTWPTQIWSTAHQQLSVPNLQARVHNKSSRGDKTRRINGAVHVRYRNTEQRAVFLR